MLPLLLPSDQPSPGGKNKPLPCRVRAAGDYAAAIKASKIEELTRLGVGEVTRWETFA